MLLQTCVSHHRYSSSLFSYSPLIPCKIPTLSLPRSIIRLNISCSISQVDNQGTERRPIIKWYDIYAKISILKDSDKLTTSSALTQLEREGKQLTKWELNRVVKELRKYRRFRRALEVYDWMIDRAERFELSSSDAAIHLDLVAKVRGVSSAENYFLSLPDALKDRRIYGALLNAYAGARMQDKAESMLDEMRSEGHAVNSLPFNVIMTLYLNSKNYEKVESIISEMKEKKIQLDMYSYNIWLSSRGYQGSAEPMEQVFEQMKLDRTITPNWTVFSTMSTMYIKMGDIEKAEACLKKVESRISNRDRTPYYFLLNLYGNVGNKEEVYRVWNVYKSCFPRITNHGYHCFISSLIKVGDFEGAEKIYEEWLTVKSTYDPKIANIFIEYYIKQGDFDKAQSFYDHMVDVGGKPNPSTWQLLAEVHIEAKSISEALSCWKEAFSVSKDWRPNPLNVRSFFQLCEKEADLGSKEVLLGFLKQSGHLNKKSYALLVGLSDDEYSYSDVSVQKDRTNDDNEDDEKADDGSDMLLNQVQGAL